LYNETDGFDEISGSHVGEYED